MPGFGSQISDAAKLLQPNDALAPTDPFYTPVSTLPLNDFVLDNLPPNPIAPSDPFLGELLSQDYLQTDFLRDTVQFLHDIGGPDNSRFSDYFLSG
jgi:hypothetical protein